VSGSEQLVDRQEEPGNIVVVLGEEEPTPGRELRRLYSGRVTLLHHLCYSFLFVFHPCCIILAKTPLMVALMDTATVCRRRPPPAGDHHHL
jgi:hypothetical protein